MKDVHTEHCCKFHGCKYGDGPDCSVEGKGEPQSHPCEVCLTPEEAFEALARIWVEKGEEWVTAALARLKKSS